MTPKIVRINPTVLYSLGFDRPTVEALLNLVRITGNETDGVTVPELSGQVDQNADVIKDIQQQIFIIQLSTDFLEAAPVAATADISLANAIQLLPSSHQQVITERVESLQAEVRQVAEQVAMLMKMLQEDIGPRADQAMQSAEFLQVEVRQIADQQISNSNLIQELKQGTML